MLSSPKPKVPSRHDSARSSVERDEPLSNAFEDLVAEINKILGPSNGIDSADVNVEELEAAMERYRSVESDWSRYAFADYSRAYTRNLVDRGNGKSNLLILVWTPGKSSPVHDHANAHCVMKILKGSLTETIYHWPCQSRSLEPTVDCSAFTGAEHTTTEHSCSARGGQFEPTALRIQRQTTYETDGVTYMSDRLGLHRVGNASATEVAVSLHLYTPPNAAKHGCHIFDEKTGQKSHVQQCHFYSELGVKT